MESHIRTKKNIWALVCFTILMICQAFTLDIMTGYCDGRRTEYCAGPSPKTDKVDNVLKQYCVRADTELDLKNNTIMFISDQSYNSTQGMCIFEERYLVLGRYLADGAKDLMIYDLVDKRIVGSNVFQRYDLDAPESGTNVDLGHLNALAYHDGFLYVPRLSGYQDIIRLKIKADKRIVFDSVVYKASGDMMPLNIAFEDGYFYWMTGLNEEDCFQVFRTKDFKSIDLMFRSDFDGRAAFLTPQGMEVHEGLLLFSFSGRLNAPMLAEGIDQQKIIRSSEKIIVTKLDGTIMKNLVFSRGNYGEIEDICILKENNREYLIISCNQNDNAVACVYAVPLSSTGASPGMEASNLDGTVYEYQKQGLIVYCDNRACYKNGQYYPLNANPFASGLTQDPFTDVHAALTFVLRHNVPATIVLSGEYGNLVFQNLPSGMNFVLDDARIHSLRFVECPAITLEGRNSAILSQLKAEKSTVLVAPGISMVNSELSAENAVEAYYSIVTGSFVCAKDYRLPLKNFQSILNVTFGE